MVTRRGLLGAMAVVPALALPTLPAMASTGGLTAALAAWKRADREAARFREAVFEPAHAAWRARINAIPHVGSEFTDITGLKYPVSTREEWAVRMARKELASKKTWHPDDHDYRDYCQKIADGADWRASEEKRITATCGINPLWERMEALDEATAEALDSAFNTPSASLHELHEKMEMIADRDGFDVGDWTQAIMADVRRLAGKGC
jgi:hypothetical protein